MPSSLAEPTDRRGYGIVARDPAPRLLAPPGLARAAWVNAMSRSAR
jgi:hypothetical protein